MSDAENYGASLSKHDAPMVSNEGAPLDSGKLIDPALGEVDPADFIRPADAPPMGAPGIPPFQLPGGDEDEPTGSVPAHHTAESEQSDAEFREKIRAKVKIELEEYEKTRVALAQKHLADARELAPDIAKTMNSIVNSLVTEGFSRDEAVSFAKTILDRKLHFL